MLVILRYLMGWWWLIGLTTCYNGDNCLVLSVDFIGLVRIFMPGKEDVLVECVAVLVSVNGNKTAITLL